MFSEKTTAIAHPNQLNQREAKCGIGKFRPKWLQKMANKFVFVVIFAFMTFFQASYYQYLRSVVSTLEKQLSIQTTTASLLFIGTHLSQIIAGLALAYYGGRGNRPRWIACGLLIACAACVIMASPILIYSSQSNYSSLRNPEGMNKTLCVQQPSKSNIGDLRNWKNASINLSSISTNKLLATANKTRQSLKIAGPCNEELSFDSVVGFLIIFAGTFILGIGFTVLKTLAYPYLDDHFKKSTSALFIAFVLGMEVAGPTFGSLLAGVCLKFHVTLTSIPGVLADDPRWIGAWWLGFIVTGMAFGAGALMVVFFPRQLTEEELTEPNKESTKVNALPTKGENNETEECSAKKSGCVMLMEALSRLLRNKILMFQALARCLTLFGTNGFEIFQSKYVEFHFWQTASEASFTTGVLGNIMRIVGILLIGITFRFWKPKTAYINGWNVTVGLLYVLSLIGLLQLKCPTVNIVGVQETGKHTATLATEARCQLNCSCDHVKFRPICLNNQNYFSACHAGCQGYIGQQPKHRIYTNCSCGTENMSTSDWTDKFLNLTSTTNDSNPLNIRSTAKSGYCPFSCSSYTIYLVILSIQKALMATRKVGRLLITLRCIDEKDKSIALALNALMEDVIAYIPSPIIYGALLDGACKMWGTNCGQRVNCWLYDSDYLRKIINGITLCLVTLGTALDGYVLHLCKKLSLFEDDAKPKAKKQKYDYKKSADVLSKNSLVILKSIHKIEVD